MNTILWLVLLGVIALDFLGAERGESGALSLARVLWSGAGIAAALLVGPGWGIAALFAVALACLALGFLWTMAVYTWQHRHELMRAH